MTGTETQERPWTAREDAVVRCCAGPHDAAWEGWGRLLPGRTELAIRARAKRLGPKAGDGWARVLPGRAPAAIAAMARRLRVLPPGGPATAHGAS